MIKELNISTIRLDNIKYGVQDEVDSTKWNFISFKEYDDLLQNSKKELSISFDISDIFDTYRFTCITQTDNKIQILDLDKPSVMVNLLKIFQDDSTYKYMVEELTKKQGDGYNSDLIMISLIIRLKDFILSKAYMDMNEVKSDVKICYNINGDIFYIEQLQITENYRDHLLHKDQEMLNHLNKMSQQLENEFDGKVLCVCFEDKGRTTYFNYIAD